MPTSEIYQENNVLQITPASTNPRITERNMWNIFRTCGRDDQQGQVAGEYIVKNFKDKKVAIVHDKTTYGQGLADETKKAMNAGGVREVLYEGVNLGDKDFFGAHFQNQGGRHRPALLGRIAHRRRADRAADARPRASMRCSWAATALRSDEFATIGGPGVEGTLMTYGPDPRKRPEAKAVVEKFRAKNFEPESYTLYSYASVQVIALAAQAANSIEPKKVADEMRSGRKFSTVIGDLSFDKKGDVARLDYVMYVWKKDASGKITYVEINQ